MVCKATFPCFVANYTNQGWKHVPSFVAFINFHNIICFYKKRWVIKCKRICLRIFACICFSQEICVLAQLEQFLHLMLWPCSTICHWNYYISYYYFPISYRLQRVSLHILTESMIFCQYIVILRMAFRYYMKNQWMLEHIDRIHQ